MKVFKEIPFAFVSSVDETILRIQHSIKTILIISGKEVETIVSKYLNNLERAENLYQIIIFSSKDSKDYFVKQYKDVPGVRITSDNKKLRRYIDECLSEMAKNNEN